MSYEQIKDDIISFIRFLVQSPQDITLRDFESFNFAPRISCKGFS